MRTLALSLALACASPRDALAATNDPTSTAANDPAAAGQPTSPAAREPASPAPALPPPALRMTSEIPRWPFIAGACLVFLVMAALGLRRRS